MYVCQISDWSYLLLSPSLVGRQQGRSLRCLAELHVQSGTWMASPIPPINEGHSLKSSGSVCVHQ